MIKVDVNNLEPGMVLAKSLFNPEGDLFAPCGYTLTTELIQTFTKNGVPYCWTQENPQTGFLSEPLIQEHLEHYSGKKTQENPNKVTDLIQENAEKLFESIESLKTFHQVILPDDFATLIDVLTKELHNHPPAVAQLILLNQKSSHLFNHSLYVCATAISLGQLLGFSARQTIRLGLSCLFMDVGKIILPDALVQKNIRQLSFKEFLIYQEHTSYGYALLKEIKDFPKISNIVTLQHHERQDGAGYPQRLRGMNNIPPADYHPPGNRIHFWAEIASVADRYINLIFPRVGAELPKTPEHAKRILQIAAGSELNSAIVEKFIRLIPNFPEGAKIVVNRDSHGKYAGYTGYVSKFNKQKPNQPEIILCEDRFHQSVPAVKIDLTEARNLDVQLRIV